MNVTKLINPITISVVGVLLTVIAAVLIYALLIQKTLADLTVQTSTYQANEQYLGVGPRTQADAQVEQAKLKVQEVTDQWSQILYTKNPVIDFSDRMTAWNEYINEVNFHLAPSVEQWLPSTGIKPTAPITTPAPPADPNAVVAKNPIVIPLDSGSAISVIGSFPQILHHVAAWNDFNRIVLIDNLTLTGISPFVTGSYKATIYEFPHNGTTPGPAVPSTAGAVGTPGGPGGPPGAPPGR